MSQLAKIKEMKDKINALRVQASQLGTASVNIAKEILKTDDVQFYTESGYDDNDHFTIVGLESFADVDAKSLTRDLDCIDNVIIQKYLSCPNHEEANDEFEDLHAVTDFLDYIKKHKIPFEEAYDAILLLSSLPEEFIYDQL